VATKKPIRRGSANPPTSRTVRASLTIDNDLHTRWGVAASIAGVDRNAFAVDLLRTALSGIVIIDRRKSAGGVDPSGEVDRANSA
jgi:hypothetical protein